MHFVATITATLAVASSALALGQAKVVNNCKSSVWLTINRPGVFGQAKEFKSKATYHETYKGTGNSIGITKSSDFYSASTPKLIFGYSDQSPTVFYSVAAQDGAPSFGSPSPGFKLTATGNCPGSNGYNNGKTLTCSDAQSITVTLC
jgi:hypothetical protein